ncbi:hypothetical protein DNL40_12700 [Xylanimonas oleitrophica]|uniref:AMIN-like domain-containing protein n=1 Tax=Xylanimonas oleitrophica TaxID=2607479 RepID=A0A2W5WNF2_9MICO|nr:hypothetical protein [Xylanimonas oleitrophica]PZR52283.1 hypothetical protein DNL40_12700 [Xylanimonas oleitrophica]
MRRTTRIGQAGTTATAVAAVLLLAACGGGTTADDRQETADTNPSAGSPSTPAASPSTPGVTPGSSPTAGAPADDPTAETPFAGSDAASADPSSDAMLTVTNVRVAEHDGFDRVVFDLDGTGTPGWEVEYVDQATDGASGQTVDVNGDGVLQVRISGTGMPTDTGVEEYSGDTVRFDGDAVEEVVYRFVYEGYTTAFIGVDESDPKPFRVFTLENPTRVVVDVED